ncbi:unnamed protein product [Adineta ricciae]|uniref:C3H1-type domain-containing protein n=1 Tax=Adineta ricciae TaxID=249248 RepID=A0A813W218_ADIRI|nr:unnamed protein product [Adineta ricciae]CAF1138963.1 unnamed protein product [Adineta ricciae]
MQKSNDDCFYFLTSSCVKGPACPYRHNPLVLTCNVMCPAWLRGNCVDPACSLRHSAIQRPTISNGVSCFYENTPMGCLKPDCTYVHLRARPMSRASSIVRSSATNLVNKDATKPPAVTTSPSVEPVSTIPATPFVPPPVEISAVPDSPPAVTKIETPPRRVAIPAEKEQKEVTPKSTTVIQPCEEAKTTPQPASNRNVVMSESSNVPSRTVVHRVVVSSDAKKSAPKTTTNDSDSDIDLDDLTELESNAKKVNSPIDIPFPCSAPSITNRLFISSKPSPSADNNKPIRLNRDRLPAAKATISNSTSSPSQPVNGEKTSAGTGLSQDDERKLSRLERFKKQPTPPPRTVVNSTRNVVNSKRSAPDQSVDESPPAKRLSSQSDNNHRQQKNTTIGDLCSLPPSSSNSRRTHERPHRRRRSSSSRSRSGSRSRSRSPSRSRSRSRSPSPSHSIRKPSPPHSNYKPTSSMNDTAWKREVDAFLAKTTQSRPVLPTASVQPQPVPLFSVRPRYVPPRPLMSRPVAPRAPILNPRPPRQPISTTPMRPTAPVISAPRPPSPQAQAQAQLQPNPIQQTPTVNNSSPTDAQKEEDERLLLGDLDAPSDVVDTFALIDEALLGVDDFLELE